MRGFGEIFEEWERLRSEEERAARRKPASDAGKAEKADAARVAEKRVEGPKRAPEDPKGKRKQGKIREALSSWLDAHGVEGAGDRDHADGEPRAPTLRELEAQEVDASLDLHGLGAAAALEALERFFREAAASGARKVLIVHGKGLHSKDEPVLKEATRRFLEGSRLAGRRGSAPQAQGGSGATWVMMRRGTDQRSR